MQTFVFRFFSSTTVKFKGLSKTSFSNFPNSTGWLFLSNEFKPTICRRCSLMALYWLSRCKWVFPLIRLFLLICALVLYQQKTTRWRQVRKYFACSLSHYCFDRISTSVAKFDLIAVDCWWRHICISLGPQLSTRSQIKANCLERLPISRIPEGMNVWPWLDSIQVDQDFRRQTSPFELCRYSHFRFKVLKIFFCFLG